MLADSGAGDQESFWKEKRRKISVGKVQEVACLGVAGLAGEVGAEAGW